VRKCQNAVAFRLVMVKNGDGVEEKKLMPCSPGVEGCIEMTIMELASNKDYGSPPHPPPPPHPSTPPHPDAKAKAHSAGTRQLPRLLPVRACLACRRHAQSCCTHALPPQG
jgi:hypothetical protein